MRDGRYELAIKASLAWARSLDMKPVVVRELVGPCSNGHEVVFAGVARARVAPGGYAELRVFTLKPVVPWSQKDWDFPYTYVTIGWSGRDRVAPLVGWDEGRELASIMAALPKPKEEQ